MEVPLTFAQEQILPQELSWREVVVGEIKAADKTVMEETVGKMEPPLQVVHALEVVTAQVTVVQAEPLKQPEGLEEHVLIQPQGPPEIHKE